MESYRQRTEEFMRRYWREGNRVLRVLAVPAAIGAVLVVGGWLILGPLTIPRFSTEARWSYASEAFPIAVYRASSSISRGVEALYGSSANQY